MLLEHEQTKSGTVIRPRLREKNLELLQNTANLSDSFLLSWAVDSQVSGFKVFRVYGI